MESYDELKKQAVKLLNGLSKKKMRDVVEILQLIASGNGLKIHSPNGSLSECSTNIPNSCLTVTINDSDLGPREEHVSIATPYEFEITKIIDNYILTNGKKFTGDIPGYVLKGDDEVLMHKGEKVFKGFIFYSRYNGAVSKLYVTEDDYNKEINGFCVATSKLQRIVPIEKLDKELQKCKERHEFWRISAHWD